MSENLKNYNNISIGKDMHFRNIKKTVFLSNVPKRLKLMSINRKTVTILHFFKNHLLLSPNTLKYNQDIK